MKSMETIGSMAGEGRDPVSDLTTAIGVPVRRSHAAAVRLSRAPVARMRGALRITRLPAAIATIRLRRAKAEADPVVGGGVKRGFDVVVGGAALIVASPFIALAALAIRLQDGGPAFFCHDRVGRGGRTFSCMKLRTMVVNADVALRELLERDPGAAQEWAETHKLKNDPRVTWLGRFLRKSSIDELPQLINIVRGDMSVVGPRPVEPTELEQYGAHRERYLAVRPGLTGPWQISGRNDSTYEAKVLLNTTYAETWSLGRDIMIVTKTIPAVMRARGAY
ncbi:sugar transferase [Acuticoccus sp.]|uniref:sugar transferase n=1 Tax=Acuticoccus sp. TaxID=1904378 RepID=UPI003B51EA36